MSSLHIKDIKELIPQREPFLFVDHVKDIAENKIITSYKVTGAEDFFKGHFPGRPIMPGVLLQEGLFQSAAALLSSKPGSGLGVVTRVSNAKFKNMVVPGDELIMEVELVETMANANFCKGKTTVNGKTVLVLEFAVASIENN